jgi:hypothetical protein
LLHIKKKELKNKMTRKTDRQHVEATPHFDGDHENIYNDPTATAGSTFGIQMKSTDEFSQERNPYGHLPEVDEEMKEFEKLMRDKNVNPKK